MSLGHGASIIRDGLILHLDAANPKSYNPNMIEYSEKFNNAYWTNNGGTIFVSTTELAPDGSRTATTLEDDNSAGYEWISRAITVPNDNQTYSLSIFVRKTSGGTAPGFAVNTILTGGTQVSTFPRLNTDTGVVSSASVLDLGNYWRMYWTITNNTSGNTSLNVNIYPAARLAGGVSDTNTATGTATIWGMMITRGSTLLDYVPNSGKSSNTFYDTSGNAINGTLQNGTLYSTANKGVMTFDGVDDYVSFTMPQTYLEYTFSFFCKWISLTASTSRVFGISNYGTYTVFNPANVGYHYNQAPASTTVLSSNVNVGLNNWCYITVSESASTPLARIYINGIQRNSTATISTSGFYGTVSLGAQWKTPPNNINGNCEIANFKLYNRILSAAEVLQNFNALRGRFGI